MATVTVWSDIHCPWASVVVHRLRKARDEAQPGLVFDQRPWPLELVNGQGTPQRIVAPEAAVLSNHEPELFSVYANDSWPSTFLPGFELVAAARQVQGLRAAEDVDYALRVAFFRHSVDVSIEAGLAQALELAELPGADDVLAVWRQGAVRADVFADYERSKSLPIQGSPQVFWPDGTSTHNPGLDDHEWVRGIPRVLTDDAEAPMRLLQQKVRG